MDSTPSKDRKVRPESPLCTETATSTRRRRPLPSSRPSDTLIVPHIGDSTSARVAPREASVERARSRDNSRASIHEASDESMLEPSPLVNAGVSTAKMPSTPSRDLAAFASISPIPRNESSSSRRRPTEVRRSRSPMTSTPKSKSKSSRRSDSLLKKVLKKNHEKSLRVKTPGRNSTMDNSVAYETAPENHDESLSMTQESEDASRRALFRRERSLAPSPSPAIRRKDSASSVVCTLAAPLSVNTHQEVSVLSSTGQVLLISQTLICSSSCTANVRDLVRQLGQTKPLISNELKQTDQDFQNETSSNDVFVGKDAILIHRISTIHRGRDRNSFSTDDRRVYRVVCMGNLLRTDGRRTKSHQKPKQLNIVAESSTVKRVEEMTKTESLVLFFDSKDRPLDDSKNIDRGISLIHAENSTDGGPVSFDEHVRVSGDSHITINRQATIKTTSSLWEEIRTEHREHRVYTQLERKSDQYAPVHIQRTNSMTRNVMQNRADDSVLAPLRERKSRRDYQLDLSRESSRDSTNLDGSSEVEMAPENPFRDPETSSLGEPDSMLISALERSSHRGPSESLQTLPVSLGNHSHSLSFSRSRSKSRDESTQSEPSDYMHDMRSDESAQNRKSSRRSLFRGESPVLKTGKPKVESDPQLTAEGDTSAGASSSERPGSPSLSSSPLHTAVVARSSHRRPSKPVHEDAFTPRDPVLIAYEKMLDATQGPVSPILTERRSPGPVLQHDRTLDSTQATASPMPTPGKPVGPLDLATSEKWKPQKFGTTKSKLPRPLGPALSSFNLNEQKMPEKPVMKRTLSLDDGMSDLRKRPSLLPLAPLQLPTKKAPVPRPRQSLMKTPQSQEKPSTSAIILAPAQVTKAPAAQSSQKKPAAKDSKPPRSHSSTNVSLVDNPQDYNEGEILTKKLTLEAKINGHMWNLIVNFNLKGDRADLIRFEPKRVRLDDQTLWEDTERWNASQKSLTPVTGERTIARNSQSYDRFAVQTESSARDLRSLPSSTAVPSTAPQSTTPAKKHNDGKEQ